MITQNTGTIPVEQKQPYDKYDIEQKQPYDKIQEPFLQKQPYDKYDIAQNTGTTEYRNHSCRTETTL